MAKGATPRRARNVSSNNGSSSRPRTRARRPVASNAASDIYNEMIAEASATDATDAERPLKRRKVNARPKPDATAVHAVKLDSEAESHFSAKSEASHKPRRTQTIDLTDTEFSDDDLDFEDVDIVVPGPETMDEHGGDSIADISVTVENSKSQTRASTASRKKGVSAAEKAQRLFIHKFHVICLVAHGLYRNHWCNDHQLHNRLRSTVDSRIVKYLTLGPDKSQFERNRWFMQGLQELLDAFKASFKVCASGLRRSQWTDEADASTTADVAMIDRDILRDAARTMQGSQDCGNTLFCALLRSIGVGARLVCSLQPLPFGSTTAKPTPSISPIKSVVNATASVASDSDTVGAEDETVKSSARLNHVPSVRRRLGLSTLEPKSVPKPKKTTKKAFRPLAFPVFWVEAFDAAHQKWIPIDPIVTHTVDQAAKLEPPLSYHLNQLSYVIAFESDGVAKDVTRRYAKAYNAKTRRFRVESVPEGAKWFESTMRPLRRPGPELDRDQVETAELTRKAAREGMPTNVLDFRDHPYYVLERHIRRHEALHPRRQVGKVNTGTNANPKMEAVFRRQDVVVCRSADKWYRLGRDVQNGEHPIKHVPARRRTIAKFDEEPESEPESMTALYSLAQTQVYIPPPVVDGRVPRNAYGNLDVYVPSMVPSGGVHIRHDQAKQAARTLGADFADAVTGFRFQGRKGTAVIEGVVVAEEYEEAMWSTIERFVRMQEEDESVSRSVAALISWKRFLTVLRVRERLSEYGELKMVSEDEDNPHIVAQSRPTDTEQPKNMSTAGRFSLRDLKDRQTRAKKARTRRTKDDSESDWPKEDGRTSAGETALTNEEYAGGGFLVDDDDHQPDVRFGDWTPDDVNLDSCQPISGTTADDGFGGGFIVDDEPVNEATQEDISRPRSLDVEMGPSPTAADNDQGGGFILGDDDHQNVDDVANNNASDPAQLEMSWSKDYPDDRNDPSLAPYQHSGEELRPSIYDHGEAPEEDEISEPDSLLSHDPDDEDAEPDWLESE